MKKNYNFIFLMIWGILFGGIPLVILITTKNWFLLLFVIIGFTAFIFGIINMIKMFKDKNLSKNGKDGVGTFITSTCYGKINNVPMYKIIFQFKNENNEIVEIKTNEIYTFDEVEIFRNLKNFKIKFRDNHAVIISNKDIIAKSELLNVCSYCGLKFDGEKCPNCGAIKNKNN